MMRRTWNLRQATATFATPAAAHFHGRLDWLLRIGMAMCFIGHGAFGVLQKEAWLDYFALAGIEAGTARLLMPLIGVVDISVGVAALFAPMRMLFAYGVLWSLWTALLRPLAGEGVWEAAERAGNYGVPLALLVLAGLPRQTREWLAPITPAAHGHVRLQAVFRVLQATTVLLLAGHGALLLGGRPLFLEHWALLGVSGAAVRGIGAGEIALAAAALLTPSAALFGGIVLWKIATEALFPLSGAPLWEWIERGGSYIAPAAAAFLMARSAVVEPAALSPSRMRGVLRIAAIWPAALLILVLPGALRAQVVRPDANLLEQLRDGGFVLACRHAITNHDQQDRNVDFDDPRTQRILSEAGEQQAQELGDVLRRLEIPVAEVFTSPYQRTRRSAELAFGRATVESALYHAGSLERRRDLLGRDVPAGTNRVLMTHQGVLYNNLPVERGSIGEGDCVIARPQDGALTVLAQARLEDWLRLLKH